MKWNFLSNTIPASLDELIDVVLHNRAIEDKNAFLSPVHPRDITPESVGISRENLEKAAKKIRAACQAKEPIIIYGDYDCDGVCATAILWEALHAMGCKVLPFIPQRERHGYGLSHTALDEILQDKKPAILITVDNGVTAHSQFARLRDAGVYTILTDHHQPDETLPPSDCIIHTTQLCGTTVAWMLARMVNKSKADATLDLCAIATIADQVPLLGANRSFAHAGLIQLNQTTRLGLQLLMEVAGLKAGAIDSFAVNFGIAPRINAMGRLESALDALRAVCSTKEENGRKLIGKLSEVNQTRQDLTVGLIEKALLRSSEWEHESIIIVDDPEFHEGIIGLIASKLTERFFKPSVCIAVGEQTSKASCRSVSGVHITNLLRSVREDLLEVGGHPLAAGFKIETQRIDQLKKHLYKKAKETIDPKVLIPQIDIDCTLPLHLLTLETALAIRQLEPFGSANRQPLFCFDALRVQSVSTVGKEGKHLKIIFVGKESETPIHGIGFGLGHLADQVQHEPNISVAGYISINSWRDRQSVQCMIKNITWTEERDDTTN